MSIELFGGSSCRVWSLQLARTVGSRSAAAFVIRASLAFLRNEPEKHHAARCVARRVVPQLQLMAIDLAMAGQ